MKNKQATYHYCETLDSLVNFVAGHIQQYDCGIRKEFGEMTIMVEDTPSPAEASLMSQEELGKAFKAASGAYGVQPLHLFDQDDTTIAVGYFAGHGIKTFTIENGWSLKVYNSQLDKRVSTALCTAFIENCDSPRTGNFLVEIKK